MATTTIKPKEFNPLGGIPTGTQTTTPSSIQQTNLAIDETEQVEAQPVSAPVSEPVTITSGSARTEVLTREQQLQQISAGLEEAKKQALVIQENLNKLAAKEAEQKKVDEEAKRQADLEAAAVGMEPEVVSPAEQRLLDINKQIDTDLQNYNTQLDMASTRMSETLQYQIRSIQFRYQQRRNQLVDLNKRYFGALSSLTTRLGGRFVPGVTTGILAAEEAAGIQRMADLDAEEASLIAEAEAAIENKKYELFSKKMAATERARDDKLKIVGELNKLSAERNKEIQDMIDAQEKAEKENMQEMIKTADALAPLVFDQLTGDSAKDLSLIQPYAQEFNIEPEILLSRALALKKAPTAQNLGQDYNLLSQFLGHAPTKEEYLTFQRQQRDAAGVSQAGFTGSDQLVQTVLQNPSLFNQLTPTDKARVAPQLNSLGFTAFGKPLSDVAIKEITQTETAIEALNDLKSSIQNNEDLLGPIRGLAALNPYSEARQLQADVDRIRQVVGKALEGGVLRKEDEEKYKKILATLVDTPTTALYKINQLIADLTRNVETYKNNQALAGRNISTESNDPLGIR